MGKPKKDSDKKLVEDLANWLYLDWRIVPLFFFFPWAIAYKLDEFGTRARTLRKGANRGKA